MTGWKKWWLALAVAAGASNAAWAQIPAAPAAAAPAAAGGASANGMVAGAPGSATVAPEMPGGMIGNTIKGCEYIKFKCRETLCNSVLGQMLNNTLKPVGAFSGGLVPPLCPPNAVNPADLAKPADSAQGSAARIKADEADAKARVAAVRYLATVDCHYWPEAQDALVNALRADRNECVRMAAAVALGTGCCCSPKTITALGITVAGTEDDGHPFETSERVRSAAFIALSRCMDRFPPCPDAGPAPEPVPEPVPPRPGAAPEAVPPPVPTPAGVAAKPSAPAEKPKVVPAVFYQRIASMPMSQVVGRARQQMRANTVVSAPVGSSHVGNSASQGLLGMAYSAMSEPTPLSSVEGQLPPLAVPPTTDTVGSAKTPVVPGLPPLTPVPAGQVLPIGPTVPGSSPPIPARQPAPLPVSPPTTSVTPAASPVRSPTSTAPLPMGQPLSVAPPVTSAYYLPGAVPPRSVVPVVATAPAPPRVSAPVSSYQAVVPVVTPALPPTTLIPPPRSTPLPPLPTIATPAPTSFARPVPTVTTTPVIPGVEDQTARWVSVLREATDPEARDWAAVRLQNVNWRTHPEVVQALVSGALRDPTPSVRTRCIRTLNQIDAGTTHVLSALDTLLVDRDPTVKRAAEEAMRALLARRRQQ